MNNVIIKIDILSKNFLIKLSSFHLNILNLQEAKDSLIIEIPKNDLSKIPKYIKYTIIKADILTRLKNFLYLNKINLIIITFFLFFFLFITNLTIQVKVIHNDQNLRTLILKELETYKITRFSFKKDYDYLTKVKTKILEKYKDQIEWLEIERVGLDYEVKVTERIIPLKEEKTNYCHITANKEGIITKINNIAGEALVHDNSHVNKGDVLISGIIKFNEEEKGYTCAKGKVYAETWYTVDIEVPMYEEEKKYTNKIRYNLKYSKGNFDYLLFKSRLLNYDSKDYLIISLFGNELYLTKEIEYNKNRKTLSEDETLKKADSLILEKLNLKLAENEHILYKKVLKKSVSGSTMFIEAFVATEEQIGVSTPYTVENDLKGE